MGNTYQGAANLWTSLTIFFKYGILYCITRCVQEGKLIAMITEEAKKTLERNIGLSMSQIYDLNVSDEIALVKAKTGKNISFTKKLDPRKIGRGNPLLARRRITTIEEINMKIDALHN